MNIFGGSSHRRDIAHPDAAAPAAGGRQAIRPRHQPGQRGGVDLGVRHQGAVADALIRSGPAQGVHDIEGLGQRVSVAGPGGCRGGERGLPGKAKVGDIDAPPQLLAQRLGKESRCLRMDPAPVQPSLNGDMGGSQLRAVPLGDVANAFGQALVGCAGLRHQGGQSVVGLLYQCSPCRGGMTLGGHPATLRGWLCGVRPWSPLGR
ncbi:hypothetical protein GCM10022245_42130 [Streptomyces mayteni]